MTNMPGSGNGGYGGGWTPPTPGQQPGTEGPRNAYGHPLAQPPQAPAGGYPPRQPGTNAYGHPLSPQQAQVPPTVPPQPGTNAYGGPLAAPQPVAPQPGYGPPPGTNGYGQPPAPAKNRKPLLIAFAIAVVVAIVGAAGWTFLNTGSSSGPDSAASAGDAVKGYLEALSRGDANGALAFSSDQPASKDFLTDDILKQQIAKWPITNIRILSDSSSSGGNSAISSSFGQVHVAVNFGDKSSDTTLTAKKDGDHWKLERAAIKVEATSSGLGNQAAANTLTIFGKPLNGNPAYVFPGFLDVASSNQWITVTTKPVLLDQLLTGGSSASLQPTYTVTDAAKTAIMAQVKTITDACTNSHAAAPPKPCDTVAFGVVDGTVNWGSADLSRIKIDNIDNYSSAGLTVRVSGQAFWNGVTGQDQWHAGAIKTLDQQSMYINGTVDLTKSPLTLSQK